MEFVTNSDMPIFIQIAQSLEEDIFLGIYEDDNKIPSTTELSVGYKINPATVLKGINLLVDQKIIYKKRGIGMFVNKGARELIKMKRLETFSQSYILPLVEEAKKLKFPKEEIAMMIDKEFDK